MSDLFVPRPVDRREAFITFGKVLVGCSFSTLLLGGCDPEIREFVSDAVNWKPIGALANIALGIVANSSVEFIDATCHECGIAIRITQLIVDVVTVIWCPACSMILNASLIISGSLLKQMTTFGFTNAVGLATPGSGYTIKKVGPVSINGQQVAVVSSAVFSDDKRKCMNALNCENPERISYRSEISSPADQELLHVWRRNGFVTDRITVKAPLAGKHCSYKEKPASGLYIVTTETSAGLILDSKAVSVNSPKARAIKAA